MRFYRTKRVERFMKESRGGLAALDARLRGPPGSQKFEVVWGAPLSASSQFHPRNKRTKKRLIIALSPSHNPTLLTGLCVRSLPSVSKQHVIVGVRTPSQDELWVFGGLVIDREEVAFDDDYLVAAQGGGNRRAKNDSLLSPLTPA